MLMCLLGMWSCILESSNVNQCLCDWPLYCYDCRQPRGDVAAVDIVVINIIERKIHCIRKLVSCLFCHLHIPLHQIHIFTTIFTDSLATKKKHKTDVDVSSFRLQPKIIGGRNDSMLSYSCFVPQNRIKKQQNETNQKMKSD